MRKFIANVVGLCALACVGTLDYFWFKQVGAEGLVNIAIVTALALMVIWNVVSDHKKQV
jgi:hypothetical protein